MAPSHPVRPAPTFSTGPGERERRHSDKHIGQSLDGTRSARDCPTPIRRTVGEDLMAKFDQDTLRKLHDCKEVAIRTTKHPGSAITIWVVVSSTDVFVRSVRGIKGRWYRDLANGGPATLGVNSEQLAVQAVPATDAGSVERASQEFLAKYRSSPYAASIVRQDVLETTLRLDPAE